MKKVNKNKVLLAFFTIFLYNANTFTKGIQKTRTIYPSVRLNQILTNFKEL